MRKVRCVITPRLRLPRLLEPEQIPPAPKTLEVEYDEGVRMRMHDAINELRKWNIEARVIVLGFRAFLSWHAYFAVFMREPHAEVAVLSLFPSDGHTRAEFLGCDVLLDPTQDDSVRAFAGVGGLWHAVNERVGP